jgi:glycosyltransferase involved in cell wall biosynthesis
MKKVLLISYSFPPANSPAAKRAFYFAKYLPEFNCQSFVLTANNQISSLGYGSSLQEEHIRFVDTPPSFKPGQRTSKEVLKPGLLSSVIRHFLFPDRGIVWAPRALKMGRAFLKKEKDIDCIFATAPSFVNILVALLLSLLFRKKLVLDFRDFYFTKGLFKRFILLRWLDYRLELWAMKRSNHILFISKGMMKCYVERYPFIKNKSSIIYNGIDLQNYASNTLESSKPNSELVKLFYAGSLYLNSAHPRDIFIILRLFEMLSKTNTISNYEFHIASNLTPLELKLFEPYLSSGSVKILGVLSQQQVEDYYKQVDACLLLLGNSEQDQFAVPIKVFEYLNTGLPILTLCPAEAEVLELLNESSFNGNCFYGKQFEEANLKVLANWMENIKGYTPQGFNQALLRKFDRKEQARTLAELIQQL